MHNSEIFRLIGEKVLSQDWGSLTKYDYELKLQSGAWQRQSREVYDRGNGATCLLYNPETDCVLLTRQFRLPIFLNGGHTGLIETPAGLLEGVGAEERMRAELIEETGFEIAELKYLFDAYMSPGAVTEYLSFFEGTYADHHQISAGGGIASEGEDIETIHIPFDQALNMITNGEICDGKTIILLQNLHIRKLQQAGAKA